MRIFYYILILFLIVGCPAPPDPVDEILATISLDLVDYWTTSVTLKISVAHTSEPWSFKLNRGDSTFLEEEVVGRDTVIIDFSLQESMDYGYTAYLTDNLTILDTSNSIVVRTRIQQEFLGLGGNLIYVLRVYQNSLYASTRDEGLWRLDILADSSEWEYLGLSRSDLGYNHYSIRDILQNNENEAEILVAGSAGIRPGVFKSQDGGVTWTIPRYQHEQYQYPMVERLQSVDGRVIGWGDDRQLSSQDFGETWSADDISSSLVPYLTRIDVFEKFDFGDIRL